MNTWSPKSEDAALSESVFFEFIPIGRAVKVIAMCSATGEEVAIVGDAKTNQSDLERLALRRLVRKLESRAFKKHKITHRGPGYDSYH